MPRNHFESATLHCCKLLEDRHGAIQDHRTASGKVYFNGLLGVTAFPALLGTTVVGSNPRSCVTMSRAWLALVRVMPPSTFVAAETASSLKGVMLRVLVVAPGASGVTRSARSLKDAGSACWTPLHMEPVSVMHFNSLQVRSAERFVFGSTDDFSLVEEMVGSDPTMRRGRRMIEATGKF